MVFKLIYVTNSYFMRLITILVILAYGMVKTQSQIRKDLLVPIKAWINQVIKTILLSFFVLFLFLKATLLPLKHAFTFCVDLSKMNKEYIPW